MDSIIGQDAPVTASLVFGGAVFWLSLSIPVGILSALRPRSILDRVSMTFVLDRHLGAPGLDRPDPLLRDRLQARTHADRRLLQLLPRSAAGAQCEGPVQWAYHLILPWITFMILFAALYVRLSGRT